MDYDDLQVLGLGQMGMARWEFGFISPRAFYNKLKGFNQLRQGEFELVRMQTVELLNVQMDKKHRITDPRKLWKFGWEKDNKKATQADAERFIKRVDGDK